VKRKLCFLDGSGVTGKKGDRDLAPAPKVLDHRLSYVLVLQRMAEHNKWFMVYGELAVREREVIELPYHLHLRVGRSLAHEQRDPTLFEDFLELLKQVLARLS
jgi:hypothetical protein